MDKLITDSKLPIHYQEALFKMEFSDLDDRVSDSVTLMKKRAGFDGQVFEAQLTHYLTETRALKALSSFENVELHKSVLEIFDNVKNLDSQQESTSYDIAILDSFNNYSGKEGDLNYDVN